MSAPLRIERAGRVARVILDRPPLNVLDRALSRALAAAVTGLAGDREIAAIVVSGGGSRGFSAGVEVADHVPETVASMLEDFHGAIRALLQAEAVTVAAIHGLALGGGFELALACDLVIAEDSAKLGLPEIGLGCYPPVAAALLPARIGWAAAAELVLLGDPITPARAQALGLVNRVCAEGALGATTDELLKALNRLSPAVLREAKRALRTGAEHPPAGALRAIERSYLADLIALDDAAEGIRAFLEKRAAEWRNR
ncbi:MAG TPA: enoyl-CoA hydratase-related protein [Candidatus Udaeobacter sp.]|jgi:cyclohexa-1,5-dienecarbonyl-CoA hydratase|nr:enoyl-CoA hydratase-related protein [Candidatus Udaeobacter sp.]